MVLLGTSLALEIISFISLSHEEKKLPPEELLSRYHNQYLQSFSLEAGCPFAETLIGHSMLGFVHRKPESLSSRCQKMFRINNIGVLSQRDLPLVRKKDEFPILILGGSVAQKIADYQDLHGELYLEKWLNQTYLSPDKKPFKIYNGALGAWSMPNQLNMLLMYGERVGGVISIDGYNESFALQAGRRLESVPAASYILANSDRLGMRVLGLRLLWAYQYAISHSFLQRSYFINVTYKIASGIYQRHIIDPEAVEEFTSGNSEDLKLTLPEAKRWSLESLRKYSHHFHLVGRYSQIKTAQFLQPSRLYGKVLTSEEKNYQEYIEKETYLSLDNLYQKMEKESFPVRSLTRVFENEKNEVFVDNIHLNARANEQLVQQIGKELGKMWGLVKIKND